MSREYAFTVLNSTTQGADADVQFVVKLSGSSRPVIECEINNTVVVIPCLPHHLSTHIRTGWQAGPLKIDRNRMIQFIDHNFEGRLSFTEYQLLQPLLGLDPILPCGFGQFSQ